MAPRFTLVRAEFVLPLAAPDRGRRLRDGYLLSEGAIIREVGPWTPEAGRRMGIRGRERVMRDFTVEGMVGRYAEMFGEALGK